MKIVKQRIFWSMTVFELYHKYDFKELKLNIINPYNFYFDGTPTYY